MVLKLKQEHLEAIIETKAMVEGLHIRVDDLTQVVLGNGDPEKGLIRRFGQAEDFIHGIKRWMWIVIGATTSGLVLAIFNYLTINR